MDEGKARKEVYKGLFFKVVIHIVTIYVCSFTNRQLVIALESFGVSATGDMEMVQQIKDEVRRLCTRYNIAAKITLNEEREDLAHQHKRFFDSSPAPSELVVSSQVLGSNSGHL